MAKLNRSESAALMSIIDKPGWDVLQKLVAQTISDLEGRKSSGSNEFEVLRSLFIQEGKVDGLKEFFKTIDEAMS